MHQLHICRSDMDLGVLSGGDARALLKTGFLRPDDLYWTKGLAEWRPLGELAITPPAVTSKGAQVLLAARGKVTSAATTVGDGATSLGRKLKSFAGAGKQQLTRSTRRVLDDCLPQIRETLTERVVVAALEAGKRAVHDDAVMRVVFGTAYDCLPRPVRRFVPESAFIQFCLERRTSLIRPPNRVAAPFDATGRPKETHPDSERND